MGSTSRAGGSRKVWLAALLQGLVAVGVLAQGSAPSRIGEVTLFGEEEFMVQAATKTEVPLSKVPGSVTVISAQQIRNSGARTIPELMRLVAGVNVRWNPMVQTIDMRSFGENPFTSRVLLLIDGVPYNSWNKGGFPQHPGFDFFILQNIKRLEIVRGPGSALYGENAFWGVINIVTLSGEDLEGGKVEVYGGDLETRSLGALYGKKVGENGSFLISGKAFESQFPTRFWFDENDAKVDGADFYLKGKIKGLELSYYRHQDKADGFVEEVPIPGLPPGAFRSIDQVEQNVDIFATKFKHEWNEGAVSFAADVSWAQRTGSHCGSCHAVGQKDEFNHSLENHGHQLIGDFRLGLHKLPHQDLLIGIEAREIDAADHQDELLSPAEDPRVVLDYTKVAGYLQDQISFADDRVRLTLGVRYDGSTDLFDDEVSPRIAAVFNVTESAVIRAGWSQAFRFPNFSELYQNSWFFTFNTDFFAIPLAIFQPNPDLRPEQISSFELGGEWRFNPNLSGKIDLYHSEVDDFIVMAWLPVPEGAPVPLHFENHPDEATIDGGEFELRWNAPKVTGFVGYAYEKTDQKGHLVDSSGKPFEFVYAPENKVTLGAFFGPFAGFRGSIEMQWRDEFQAPSFWNSVLTGVEEIAVLDSYTLLNVRLTYELPWSPGGDARPTRLSFYGKNLLDEEPVETLTGADLRLAGTTFYGGFEIGF